VADPYSFLPNYSVTVGDAEQKLLRLKNVRQVAVLVTVSIPPGRPELPALNLTGPVLVNHKMRIGLQVPQTENNGPAKFYLHPGPDGNPRTTEEADQAPPAERE
jgi:flagellar assembly factor FliW